MTNESAKSAIFARIRQGLGVDPSQTAFREALRLQEWPQIPRQFRRQGTLPLQERITLFQAILKHYGATSYLAEAGDVAAVISQVLRDRSSRLAGVSEAGTRRRDPDGEPREPEGIPVRLVVPREFPSAWIPLGIEAVPDSGLSNELLDKIDGVLTGCTVAIASTGTIVLASGRDGRRALTLVPDYQICVVRPDQIVEFIAEALEVLQPIKTLPLTFFSGPSATVDIEMTRVQGVHGPRTLDVVIAA